MKNPELLIIGTLLFFVGLFIWIGLTGWTFDEQCYIAESIDYCGEDSTRVKWKINGDTSNFMVQCPNTDFIEVYKPSKYSKCSIPLIDFRSEGGE